MFSGLGGGEWDSCFHLLVATSQNFLIPWVEALQENLAELLLVS
jgi:hypothetical protein